MSNLEKRLERIEFHQKLIVEYIDNPKAGLYKFVVQHGVSKEEYMEFTTLCQSLMQKFETEKKAESVYYTPLFLEFVNGLPKTFNLKVIDACIKHGLYKEMMIAFKKHLN
ncbi:DUF1878 family protein [Mangrovibacillus cuniculi]|uniref:DUF1878 family protein n=1 Tax=Mangrovibacillus cuniculi TaxID=2593652 RepID=A0A7S8CA34_9BACI|nr:DUF1878 family protein [Mangrovibacillus cuniculi]QPC45988.1 DUF1878 family protein [Mangrovibacillus cuniculi]